MDRYISKLTNEDLLQLINMAASELQRRRIDTEESKESYNEMLRKLFRKGIISKEQFVEKFKH